MALLPLGLLLPLPFIWLSYFTTGSGPGPNYSGDLATLSQLATQLCPLPGRMFQGRTIPSWFLRPLCSPPFFRVRPDERGLFHTMDPQARRAGRFNPSAELAISAKREVRPRRPCRWSGDGWYHGLQASWQPTEQEPSDGCEPMALPPALRPLLPSPPAHHVGYGHALPWQSDIHRFHHQFGPCADRAVES